MIQFQENVRTDGRTDRRTGRKNGQTLVYRTLLATAGGPIKPKIFFSIKNVKLTRKSEKKIEQNIELYQGDTHGKTYFMPRALNNPTFGSALRRTKLHLSHQIYMLN